MAAAEKVWISDGVFYRGEWPTGNFMLRAEVETYLAQVREKLNDETPGLGIDINLVRALAVPDVPAALVALEQISERGVTLVKRAALELTNKEETEVVLEYMIAPRERLIRNPVLTIGFRPEDESRPRPDEGSLIIDRGEAPIVDDEEFKANLDLLSRFRTGRVAILARAEEVGVTDELRRLAALNDNTEYFWPKRFF